jgi:hypothetical protein
MMRAWGLTTCLLCLGGCVETTPGGRPLPPRVAQVDEVHLRVPIPALRSVGGGPGADAIALEVFFAKNSQAGGLPVTGSLEILIYDGKVLPEEFAGKKPLHVETYTNAELKDVEGISRLGVSYKPTVPWGANRPGSTVVTVLARYIPPAGRAVYSEPVTLSLRPL